MYRVYALNRRQQAWEDARWAQARGDLHKHACENCGSTRSVLAHHTDYEKGTSVRWLCMSCHEKLHKNK